MGRKSRDSRRNRMVGESRSPVTTEGFGRPLTAVVLAWAIPGSGHLWLGRRQRGLVFLVAIPLMFMSGLWLDGALAPFDAAQPLALTAAFADLGNGLPYVIVRVGGFGEGRVVAATFEYGNTFLIVSGLLNMLVCLDAYDVALGRK